MEIVYLGAACFRIKGKAEFTKQSVTIVTDPFDPAVVGIALAKLEANIVAVSSQQQNYSSLERVSPGYFLINQPGEYEVAGVSVLGYSVGQGQKQGAEQIHDCIYVIEADGCRVCHLGNLSRDLTDSELSELGVIDVLLLPVGGYLTLPIKEARELVNRIAPTVVIPMQYLHEGMKKDEASQLQPLTSFLATCQGLKQETLEKFTTDGSSRDNGEAKVIILQRKE